MALKPWRWQSFPGYEIHCARILKEIAMGDVGVGIVGLAAVVLSLGIPMAALYTYYRVKKLRADERMAAIARGVTVPFETEITPAARSRKNAILLVSGAIGFIATFGAIAGITHEPETWAAAAFGFIPLAIGIGYFIDFTLGRNEAHS
jgi:hypothetical protein